MWDLIVGMILFGDCRTYTASLYKKRPWEQNASFIKSLGTIHYFRSPASSSYLLLLLLRSLPSHLFLLNFAHFGDLMVRFISIVY